MVYGIGKQYDRDNPFKKRARRHQSKYRCEVLQVDFDKYGNRLTESDAKSGLNFYNGFDVFNAVKERYKNQYSRGLYADMLRSEHIPFNIFVPLKTNTELAQNIFTNLLPVEILGITKIEIEYAPSPSREYLRDRTAFDVFIEYKNNRNEYGIIGIEVKYTEQEYKLQPGSKEEEDVQNKNSIYYQLTKILGLYKPNKISELPKDRYRQVWRNHLLGESMIKHKNLNYSEFTSLILYPKGNVHFTEVADEYKGFLLKQNKNKFFSITFESFFNLIEKSISSEEVRDWGDYLKARYLF